MSDPPRFNPAAAGVTLLATIVLGTGVGLGLGALVGLSGPLALAGVLVGAIAGVAVVYTRYRHI